MNQGSAFQVHDNSNLVTQPSRNNEEATFPRGIFSPRVDNTLRLGRKRKARVNGFEVHNHADSRAQFHMLADDAVDLVDQSRDWGGGRSWLGFIGLSRGLTGRVHMLKVRWGFLLVSVVDLGGCRGLSCWLQWCEMAGWLNSLCPGCASLEMDFAAM